MSRSVRLAAIAVAAIVGVLVAAPAPAVAACAGTPTRALPGAFITIHFPCTVPGTPTVVTPPQHGTLYAGVNWGNEVTFSYVSDREYRGTDRFTWAGDDGVPVTHTIDLQAPQLTCSGTQRPYGTPPPVLARDGEEVVVAIACSNHEYGDELRLDLSAAHGSVRSIGTPQQPLFGYTPKPGYTGADSVAVRVVSPLEGRSSAPFEVAMAVKGPNHPPVCAALPAQVAVPGRAAIWPPACTDPDGDALSYGLRHWVPADAVTIAPDGAIGYEIGANLFRGALTLQFVVGDGFAETPFDLTVDVRDRVDEPPPALASPPSPPGRPAATMPAAPRGFVAARGLKVGAGAAVWTPVRGIRLGQRALPVIAAGCRTSCTLRAHLRLVPERRPALRLPSQKRHLAAGRRTTVRMRLTRAMRSALRGHRRVRAVLSVGLQPDGSAMAHDQVRLRIAIARSDRYRPLETAAKKPAAD